MVNCPYCKRLNEVDVRAALEDRKPLALERIDLIEPWHKLPGDRWTARFFCDACGGQTDIVVELVGEPDPADWWKS